MTGRIHKQMHDLPDGAQVNHQTDRLIAARQTNLWALVGRRPKNKALYEMSNTSVGCTGIPWSLQ